MRVFHLITHFDLGGAERVAANIAESSTPGMEYHVVEIMRGRSAYTPRLIAELRSHGVRCHRSLVPDIRWHFLVERIAALLFPLRMLYIMLRWRPDVVHTHTETPDLGLYVFARLLPFLLRRTRIVRTIHNTRLWTGLPSLARHVERLFNGCGANVAISRSVSDSYVERFGGNPCIIHNGVGEVEQRSYTGLKPGCINILFAGRLEPQKGIATLCKVVAALGGDPRFNFIIAGDGSQRPLVAHTIAHGASGDGPLHNARLVAPIYSLASYMSSFDYLFMPSEFEGLSMLSMEASMNRLPVIANNVAGLCDTLPPSWPLMVSGNNVDDFVALFQNFIPTADRHRLAEEAHDYAAPRFSIRHMQERYEEFYAKIISSEI